MLKKATLQTLFILFFFNLSYLKKDAKDVVSASHWLNGLGHVAFYSKVSQPVQRGPSTKRPTADLSMSCLGAQNPRF